MTNKPSMLAFGPVPSRRLGRSLGINNIPPKICTYSCVYCQVGRTMNMLGARRPFYEIEEVFEAVKDKVVKAADQAEPIDFLTFVPDGEPTLDVHLGKEIEMLKNLGIKIAVISNASLIWREDVREELRKADWVSLKIDAISDKIWRKMNRPFGNLKLDYILQGIQEYAKSHHGDLVTETMLVRGINDHATELDGIADFIKEMNVKKSYLSVPTRPPAENWVQPAKEHTINEAYQIFREKQIDVEYLIGYEGNAFAFTGNAEEDLLSIISVHPMREDAVWEFLSKADENWVLIDRLVNQGKLIELNYRKNKFYMRMLPCLK